MAKRRILKKRVNYIVGELFCECLVVSKLFPQIEQEKLDVLLTRILNLQNDIVSRISHTQPGNVKGFYRALRHDFQTEVNAVIEEITNLH